MGSFVSFFFETEGAGNIAKKEGDKLFNVPTGSRSNDDIRLTDLVQTPDYIIKYQSVQSMQHFQQKSQKIFQKVRCYLTVNRQ